MERSTLQHAQEVCERVVKRLRFSDAEAALDLAELALKLPRAAEPGVLLGKILVMLKRANFGTAPGSEEIASAVQRDLAECKRKLKNYRPDAQLVALAATVNSPQPAARQLGGSEYIVGAGAAAELQREQLRAELHRGDGRIYTPPSYSGADEATKHYKLNKLYLLEQEKLAETAADFAKYAKVSATKCSTLAELCTNISATLDAVALADAETLNSAMAAEAKLLAQPAYREKLLGDAELRSEVKDVLPFKVDARCRRNLKKRIAELIVQLQADLAKPLPIPADSQPETAKLEETGDVDVHYQQLQKYFEGEYEKMPWLEDLEDYMNGIAARAAQLREAVQQLISPDHLQTCLRRLVVLYTTILKVQVLHKYHRGTETTQMLHHFSSFPKLVQRGQLQRIKV